MLRCQRHPAIQAAALASPGTLECMTRLEREDAYLRTFASELLETRYDETGHWWRLAESAFYATGGGQPHDEGTLSVIDALGEDGASWRVVGVESLDDEVWHRVEPTDPDRPAPPLGSRLRGRIDWPRRFRHMQRHTGQHLLSQAFLRVDPAFGTRSVALSSPDVTLDLAGEPGDEAVAAALHLANEVATQALPITAFEVDESELHAYPLRRPPKVSGRVRLVRMGDWELSACGGTHVRSTAEALPLLALGRERIRGGLTRVTFRAGLEALQSASATLVAAAAAARSLTTSVAELPERVLALQAEASAARRELAHARQALAAERTAILAAAPGDVVAVTLPPEEAALATDLADAVAARGASAAVGAPQGEQGFLVVTSGAGCDVRPALQAGLALLEGRGGGRPERAQGAGPARARLSEAVEAAARVLRG
jgi:alanyl-tRNA synthetase